MLWYVEKSLRQVYYRGILQYVVYVLKKETIEKSSKFFFTIFCVHEDVCEQSFICLKTKTAIGYLSNMRFTIH